MSEGSATYLRFSGLEVESAPFENEEMEGNEAEPRNCGGVPGGVVESAVYQRQRMAHGRRGHMVRDTEFGEV